MTRTAPELSHRHLGHGTGAGARAGARRGARWLSIAAVALSCCLSISGCSAGADPTATRDALQGAAETPTPERQAQQQEAEAETEPIELEPLECLPYLVVTARGTGEPSRGQLLGPVARAIDKARPDQVVRTDLDYPADTDVNGGASTGVRALVTMLNLQAQACPEQKFVLLGYSQGALVIGDALSAPDDRFVGLEAEEIRPEAAAAVSAVVLYGDPRFVGAEPYNSGDYDEARDGLLPRPTGALSPYKKKLRDYCVSDDFICQATTTGLDETGHVAYFDNGMQQDGAAFAITKLPPVAKSAQESAKSGEKPSPPSEEPDSKPAD